MAYWGIDMPDTRAAIRCRTAFISDIHLGTRGCQAELLLEFIRELDCEMLYLVGDIVDGWKLRSGWHECPHFQLGQWFQPGEKEWPRPLGGRKGRGRVSYGNADQG